MASAKRDIRSIIDSFSDDLILIAQDIARERVERAVSEWQAKNEKLLAKKSIQRTRASRLAPKQIQRHRRLAPVVDLFVPQRDSGLFALSKLA